MSRKLIPLFLTLLMPIAFGSCQKTSVYKKIEGFAQGGTYHIIYSSPKAENGRSFSDDTLSRDISGILKEIDFSISGYNRSSILSKVNRGEEVELDGIFLELFEISKSVSEETDGYFDVSGGSLYDFWGFGFKNPDRIPEIRDDRNTRQTIDRLLKTIGMDKVKIENGRLVKESPEIRLNFNAIAQGYSCDRIAAYLDKVGIENYLVEVGMEITCKGVNANGTPWRIGVDTPIDGSEVAGENIQKIIQITDCGIVTSGNYRKFYTVDGKKYAHSIDPHSGYPVSHNLLSATVIAPNATLADAYATYCMVVGKEKAVEFIKSHDGLKAYLICDDGVVDLLD